MARLNYVKRAEQRFATVPVIDPATGEQQIRTLHKKDGTPKTDRRGNPVTQRVTRADRTQPLPNPKCGRCGTVIEPGMPYRWWANRAPGSRGSYRKIRCMADACTPTLAEMTPGRRGQLMQIQSDIENTVAQATGVDELESAAQEAADAIRSLGDEFTESADNMEEGFGHETYQSQELREKAEALESVADELENLSFEDFDEDDLGLDEDLDEDDRADEIQSASETHWEEQRQLILDAMYEAEV